MSRRPLQIPWAPLAEIAVLAIGLVAANLLFWPRDPGFVSVSPHPTLLLTLLVLARYGLVPGAIAASVFTGEYLLLVALLGHRPYLWSAPLTAPLVLLVPATVFLGMLVQRHIDRRRKAEAAARRAAAEVAAITAEVSSLRDLNLQLGEKIVHAEQSASHLFEHWKALSTLDRGELPQAILRVLAEVLRVEAASLWELDGKGPRLRVWQGARPPAPFVLDPAADRWFGEDDVLAPHALPAKLRRGNLPLLVGRLRAGAAGPVVGYLAIDKLPLTASAEAARLFPLLVECASIATGNALAFEQLHAARKLQKVVR